MAGFFTIVATLILHWSVAIATSHSLINGPQPMSVVAPLGAVVTFTCVVNTTELSGTFIGFSWSISGVPLSDQETTNGSLAISALQQTVIQDYITGALVQCRVIAEGSVFMTFRSNNATLTAYGEVTSRLPHIIMPALSAGSPEAPSNLTSTQSSSNALILSWSAPSSPVQLHYTVTVRLTNTNSTSTTTITMFNTPSTTIIISRDNITGNTTECDIYLFTVTAINPAGSSIPANHTSPLTVLTGLCNYNVNQRMQYASIHSQLLPVFNLISAYQIKAIVLQSISWLMIHFCKLSITMYSTGVQLYQH